MSIKLTKSQRLDKKNLELTTGHKWSARDYLINIGKLKNATDEFGWEYSRATGSILKNNAYQNHAFASASTVNAMSKYAQQMGQKNKRRQFAKGDKNINLPFEMNGKYYDADSQPLFSVYPRGACL